MLKQFLFLFLFLAHLQSFAAAFIEADQQARLHSCCQAFESNDLDAFKRAFSIDLLDSYSLVFCGHLPVVRALNLAHKVVFSRRAGTEGFIRHMLELGLDPNHTETFTGNISRMVLSEDPLIMAGYTGTASTPLLLDLAVCAGNVAVVRVLLQHDADPYKTSFFNSSSFLEIALKSCADERIGESPRTHAMQYQQEAEYQHSQWLGSADEYRRIAAILHRYQLLHDTESIIS